MTELPRVMISMPQDIENAVREMKSQPENQRVPTSKLLCRLIRRGMENQAPSGEAAETPSAAQEVPSG